MAALLASSVLAAGCASSAEDTDGSEDALRAPRAGDVDEEVLGRTPALNPPAKFANVATWSIDYVDMKDPDPANAYRGLMLFARDRSGETLYLLPFGWSGEAASAPLGSATIDPEFFVFNAEPDDAGNLTPVTFDVGAKTSQARVASEKAALDWLVSEQKRLLAKVTPVARTQGGIRTLGVGMERAECIAHLGAFLLAGNPVMYFLVDGGIDLAFGLLDGSGEKIATGVVKGGIGGLAHVVKKKAGTKALNRGLLGVVVAGVGYNVYREGVAGGLLQTAKDLLPQSCRNQLGW